MHWRKGFENVNIKNELIFFERYGLITATVCAPNFHTAITRFFILYAHIVAVTCMIIHLSKKNNPLHKYLSGSKPHFR